MRLSADPRLPILGGVDYDKSLYQRLYSIFREVAQANNALDDAQEGLQGDISTLQGDISTLQGDISDILLDMQWMLPIGMPVPIWTDLGSPVPPTDRAFRYIKLTASDAYNTGLLTGETVSGSFPEVQAYAIIDLDGSPLNGQTVRLINTERRFLRAGDSGVIEADDFKSHDHFMGVTQIAVARDTSGSAGATQSSSARTGATGGAETRPKNIGADYFMRVL